MLDKNKKKSKKIILIGAGSQARLIAEEILRTKNQKILGFVDDKKKTFFANGKSLKYLGSVYSLLRSKKKQIYYLILCIGNNNDRRKIYNKFSKNKNFNWITVISNSSIIHKNVIIGNGTFIGSGTIINSGSKIGNHCIINTGSIIEHDNNIKSFASISSGSITGGNVSIGEASFLGLGCVVRNKIKIEKNVVIGANSYVNYNCQQYNLYIGQPAKKVKKIKQTYKYI